MEGILQIITKKAQERGHVQHNVACGVKLQMSRRPEPHRVYPPKTEIKLLMAEASLCDQPLSANEFGESKGDHAERAV